MTALPWLVAGGLVLFMSVSASILIRHIARGRRGGPYFAQPERSLAQQRIDDERFSDLNDRRRALDPEATVVLNQAALQQHKNR